jgi:simple sugar transport system ATP-binding protein
MCGREVALQLELRGITKRFGSLVANDSIDLTVESGEIHALLGENGAGKSTLMNVLYGLLQPDQGQILLDGKPVEFHNPREALAAGIGMVHQHFMLVPVFTVAENVMLGVERTSVLGLLNRRRARKDVLELSSRYGLAVDPDVLVENLPVGIQQRVEIVKALHREASVVILDEPTAVLTPGETNELFRIMRELQASGKSIIFISHKLKEVQEIADRITVIRRGRVVGSPPPTATDEELASLMVGRAVELTVHKEPAHPGEVTLEVESLRVENAAGRAVVDDISLEVRSGEIVGIAGVQGNGQTELCEAIMGLLTVKGGSIRVAGKDLTGARTRVVLESGVSYIPEDRQEDGIVERFSLADNLVLDVYNREPYASGLALHLDAIRESATKHMEEYDIRATSIDMTVGTLSGGNQQKVIVARELGREVRLLVANQPTRGLDVGSIEFVHSRLVAARDQGTAVLICSTELDEIYALADRIIVMYEGRIAGIRPPTVSIEEIGLLMAGAGVGDGVPEAQPA